MDLIKEMNISKVMRGLLYVLIFFQPFNHFNSFREISFYLLLVLFGVNLFRGGAKGKGLNDRTVIAVFLLMGWALVASAAGPYVAESLDALRKNLFKETIIFMVIVTEFRSLRELRPLLFTVVLSFAAVTLASIIENSIMNWEAFSGMAPQDLWRSTSVYFFANYADNATFYLPFIAAWAVSIEEVNWKKWLGVGTLLAGAFLVYIYNARTQLITVFLVYFVILFLAKRFKTLALLGIAALLGLTVAVTSDHEALSKYKTLLDSGTYTSDEGLTNRLGIWQVMAEVIEERPVAGYGYGWKKLAWVIQDKASDEYWDAHLPSARSYFVDDAKMMYGRVSPHNLPLQIAFEIGIVGLLIYLWLWGTVLHKIFRTSAAGRDAEARKLLLCGIGVAISFVMINITNSLWQENYGNMLFLFMAVVFVVHRENVKAVSR